MAETRHPRFWTPREEIVHLDHFGYLADPESRFTTNRHVKPVAFAAPCTVVLGEPGMGKTTALQDLLHQLQEAEEPCAFFDLPDFTPSDLSSDLLNSPQLTAWHQGAESLHLLLDSLDEGAIHISNLTRVLRRWLRNAPTERLKLYVACRAAAWPSTLEQDLRQHYGDACTVYKLAPLRRVDVEAAARCRSINAQEFLEAVHARGLAAFAHRPLTLTLLLERYMETGELPDTAAALYHAACLHLVTEQNDDRRDAGLQGSLAPEQRLAIAQRLAATMQFCGKTTLWRGNERQTPEHSLCISDVADGHADYVGATTVTLTSETLDETLTLAGLFEPRASHEVTWAHRSYTEFLAASYCTNKHMPLAQLRSLFQHGSGIVPPQLRGTAAWLATLSPDARQHFISTDPLIVVRSDVAVATHEDREHLVASLLNAIAADTLPLDEFLTEGRIDQLDHPGLADQLRPYFAQGQSNATRRSALLIAGASGATVLVPDLAAIANDTAEDASIRCTAAEGLRALGDPGAAALRPFLSALDEDLKGHAIAALWPNHLTPTELFNTLTPPRLGRHDLSRYVAQLLRLSKTLPDQLNAGADYAVALGWVTQLGRIDDPVAPRCKLARALLVAATSRLEDPAVHAAFVQAATTHLRTPRAWHQLPSLRAYFDAHHDQRRAILLGIAEGQQWQTSRSIAHTPLVHADDAEWMCARIRAHPTDGDQVAFWAQLLDRRCPDPLSPAFEALHSVYQDIAAAAPHLACIFAPVDTSSPLAAQLREQWQELQAVQTSAPAPLTPEPQLLVHQNLSAYEGGVLAAFHYLLNALTLTPESTEVDLTRLLVPNLTCYPGWAGADASTQDRLRAACQHLVLNATPTHIVGQAVTPFPDHAAYCALYTLAHLDPVGVEALPGEVWERWAPIAVDFPNAAGDEGQRRFLGDWYRRAPDTVLDVLIALLDHEASQDPGHSYALRKLADCWDAAVTTRVLTWLEATTLRPRPLRDVLDTLLEQAPDAAGWCLTRLEALVTDTTEEPGYRAIASAVLKHAAAQYWDQHTTLRANAPDLAERVLISFALEDPVHPPLAAQLDEAQLGELWTWLAQRFPPEHDPHDLGTRGFSEREAMTFLRRSLLTTLTARGTAAAHTTVQCLAAAFPQYPYVAQAALQAHRRLLKNSWLAPTPAEFAALCADADRRLVETPEELLAVTVEALERYQQLLQHDNPQVVFLWDNKSHGTAPAVYEPKPEQDLSRHAASYLQQDLLARGVLVARECEIRQGKRPSGIGKSTDIAVSASVREPRHGQRAVIQVIIEVKGCWNAELDTAMQTQLVEDYMQHTGCRHGIYLVGWYYCPAWSTGTTRTLDGLRNALDLQAATFTNDDQTVRAIILNATLPVPT